MCRLNQAAEALGLGRRRIRSGRSVVALAGCSLCAVGICRLSRLLGLSRQRFALDFPIIVSRDDFRWWAAPCRSLRLLHAWTKGRCLRFSRLRIRLSENQLASDDAGKRRQSEAEHYPGKIHMYSHDVTSSLYQKGTGKSIALGLSANRRIGILSSSV